MKAKKKPSEELNDVQWVAAVLEKATRHYAGVCSAEDAVFFERSGYHSSYRHELFWDTVPPVPPRKDGEETCNDVRSFFMNITTFGERRLFLLNQQKMDRALRDDILAIDQDPLGSLHDLQEKYLFEDYAQKGHARNLKRSRNPLALLVRISGDADVYDKNDALHFVTRTRDIAFRLIEEKSFIKKTQDLDLALASHFREEYNVDMSHGQIRTFMSALDLNDAVTDKIDGVSLSRRQAGLIEARPVSPHKIKSVPDAHIEFLRTAGATGSASSAVTVSPYRDKRGDHGFKAKKFDPK